MAARTGPVESGYHGRAPHRWVALSNTTLGMLIATINQSIVIISLPAIFRGIGVDPLGPGNTSLLLWMLMGYLLVSAVLVVSLGRLGDMFGRVRIYNGGFAVFTVASVLLAVDPVAGVGGAWWLIGWRVVQGVGGAMVMANSTAILTDAFPPNQRGMALGINQVAALAGSFIGLVAGGLLSAWDWRAVFLVSVPVGVVGTVWSYVSMRDVGTRSAVVKVDWWGNATFAVGLTGVLAAIIYGIQPYGSHTEGWTSPWVVAGLIGGVALLAAFMVIETRVAEPMFHLSLFRVKAFAAGNAAGLLSSIARGGLQFMLIVWLQGIWLPLHGYSYHDTPLWAGIYLLPLTVGFLLAGPVSGRLSDRHGARAFATGGLVLVAVTFVGLLLLPIDFHYWQFATLLALNGIGSGLFAAPNTTAIMNSVPRHQRGAASGMRATFQNAGMVLSIGVFFSLLIAGLAAHLPTTARDGLIAAGVPRQTAVRVAELPPVSSVFSAFLGYNPMEKLLGPQALAQLSPAQASEITGPRFFPNLISGPFHSGLIVVFTLAVVMSLVAAGASMLRGGRYVHEDSDADRGGLAQEAAAASGEAAPAGPLEEDPQDGRRDRRPAAPATRSR
jgi:MFS family permease